MGQHHVVSEVLARQLPGSLRVARVVSIDLANRFFCLFDRGKCEETFASRHDRAESGCLGHDWPPSGEIGGPAVTEPATPQSDILILSHRELATRPATTTTLGHHIHPET